LWSEYNVSIPEFYYYVRLTQGYQAYTIQDKKDKVVNFKLSDYTGATRAEHADFSATVSDYRWVIKDVPAMKEEGYTSSINNHVSGIEFQLSEVRHPFTYRNVMGTWEKVCEELLKDEDFGYSLNRDNGWLNDVMKDAIGNAANDIDKARNIFAYVRDNITCTNHSGKYLEKPLKTVLKTRNGNEAEINLLLTAMLLKADLCCRPGNAKYPLTWLCLPVVSLAWSF
jgi:hypothetical protein